MKKKEAKKLTVQTMLLEQLLLCHWVNSARKEYCLEEGIHPECYQPLVLDAQNDTSMLLENMFYIN